MHSIDHVIDPSREQTPRGATVGLYSAPGSQSSARNKDSTPGSFDTFFLSLFLSFLRGEGRRTEGKDMVNRPPPSAPSHYAAANQPHHQRQFGGVVLRTLKGWWSQKKARSRHDKAPEHVCNLEILPISNRKID